MPQTLRTEEFVSLYKKAELFRHNDEIILAFPVISLK